MPDAYDPLSYDNLARSVVSALMDRTPEPLPPAEAFAGSGVYAIYYTGAFEPYRPLASAACERPIYVGKAIPPGGRKGAPARDAASGATLFRRLSEL